MRIMWTVFVTFPEVADKIGRKSEYACTWARALAAKLRYRDDIELAIVSVADEDSVKKFRVDNVDFYFLPNGKEVMRSGGGEKIRESWKYIISDFKPDLVHIHGSESMVPYELIKMKPNVPLFLTLQGILSNYYKDAYAGMEMKDIIRTYSLRDIVRHSGIIWDRKKEIRRSRYEKEMLRGIQYVGGRTTWDKVSSLAVNPETKYIYAPELIRPEFYQATRWDVNKIRHHRIFMHQGFKPIKGLHILLDANNLTEVVETKNIVKTVTGAEADGVVVDVNSLVSMNMWGLTPEFLEVLEQGFKEFFKKEVPGNPLKAEYLIPIFIGDLLEQGKMSVKVLKTNDTWYGMTYHEDVAAVKDSFKKMLEDGVYKVDLFADL